jgi:pimeloyl-ACP methyl ester carboxylesterase
MHGAWCWSRVTDCLRDRGVTAVAVDLPGHGSRITEKATFEAYRDAVVDVIEPGDVLVGHSMGGYVITAAADQALDRVSGLIYVAGAVPDEGQSMLETSPPGDTGFEAHVDVVETEHNGRCLVMRDVDAAAEYFYDDCSAQDRHWAFERLTPQPLEPYLAPIHVPRFWSAAVPRRYLLCSEDRCLACRDG